MFVESVMLSNHLILCLSLLLLPSIFPSIRVFSNELALRIRWPKYWSFSHRIHPCFPSGSAVKNLPANAGDTRDAGSTPKIPRSRKWQPTLVFLPGKYHGQRSLEGYRPWGSIESYRVVCHTGFIALKHVESSRTRDQTHVPLIGR